MTTTGPSSAARPAVTFIFIVMLLDTLGIGLIIPILPKYLAGFSGGNLAGASHSYGILVAVYSAMQFLCAPMLGALSDRYGRRPVIFLSLFGAALNYLLTAFAPSLGWMLVGRVIAGASAASFSVAAAYIADVTPPEKRAQNFGLIGAAFGLGFIAGPALGGLLGRVDLRLPFLVAAALNGLNLAYGLFVLPESLSLENRRSFSIARANPLAAFRHLSKSPVVMGLLGTIICGYLAQWILQSSWALHTEERFGWGSLEVGASLSVVGVASAIVQGLLIKRAIHRLGEQRAVIVGLLFNIAGFLGFALANRPWMFIAVLFPFALGGISGPSLQSLISRSTSASEQGELQGSLASLQSLCAIVGPLVGTQLFSRFSTATSSPHIPGAPLFAAALCNIVGLALAVRLFAKSEPVAAKEAV